MALTSGDAVRVPEGTPPAASRIASIDVVRLLALLAIVIGHVYTTDLEDRLIQSWRLPVFFMLSGYFWSPRRTLREELRKRTRSLLVPYVAWVAIIFPIAVAAVALGLRSWELEGPGLIRAVIGGGSYAQRPFQTLWFFTALFVAVMVYRWLTDKPTWLRLAVVVLGLAANAVGGSRIAEIPFSIGSAFVALVFLETGRAIRTAQRSVPPRWLAAAAATVLTLGVVLVYLPADFVPLNIKTGRVPVLATAAALLLCSALLLAATAVRRLPDRVVRVVNQLAAPSFVVIMAHPLILWFFRPEDGRVPQPLLVAIAFLVPLALGMLIVRSRASQVLAGVPRFEPSRAVARSGG